jgi:hypothetical protein
MMSLKHWAPYAAGCLLAAGAILRLSPAQAQAPIVVYTEWGQIESVSSAWKDDAMGVHLSTAFVNSRVRVLRPTGQAIIEDECKTVNDGYATDPADPGHKLHHAIILGAYLHHKQTRLLLQGCAYDKPRIISVEVKH